MDEKIEVLVQWLNEQGEDVTAEDVSQNYGDEYSVNGADYLVLTDEEADEAAKQDVKDRFDDMGLESFSENFQEEIINNHTDKDYFWDDMHESNASYCRDIAEERDYEFGNRLVQECYERELIDDDDFEKDEEGEPDHEQCIFDEDELVDKLTDDMDSGYDNSVEWAKYVFGNEEISRIAKEHPDFIDIDAVAEAVVSSDGRNSLAGYDRLEHEIEYNGEYYYIYRTN